MKSLQECPHMSFAAMVEVARLEDVGRFCADITIKCADCGQPFRFICQDAGYSPDRPTVNVDGTVLNAPIEPELVKVLHTSLRYDVS